MLESHLAIWSRHLMRFIRQITRNPNPNPNPNVNPKPNPKPRLLKVASHIRKREIALGEGLYWPGCPTTYANADISIEAFASEGGAQTAREPRERARRRGGRSLRKQRSTQKN